MYSHLGLNRISVPPASKTGSDGRPASHSTPRESSAVGSVSAIALVTTTMVIGAALITATPHTVTVPIATVLASGLIASALVAAGDRWLAFRRRA